MSKYIRVNGKLYKAADGWSDDAKKGAALAQKILKDINNLRLLAKKSHDLAKSTNAYVAVLREFGRAEDGCVTAMGGMENTLRGFRDAASR